MKRFKWKLLLVVTLVVLAFIYVIPSVVGKLPAWWTAIGLMPQEKIHLGLDLQGGVHLVLEVQTEKAVESRMERIAEDLRETIKKEKIRPFEITRPNNRQISVRVYREEDTKALEKMLDKDFGIFRIVSKTPQDKGLVMVLDLPSQEIEYVREMATKQALETIRNRIDQFGVSEPDILRQGDDRILVQLPGVKDPERAKNLIGKTALLEFKLVDEDNDPQDALNGNVPPGDELLFQVIEDEVTGRTRKTPFLVKKRTYLTGEYLTDARVQIDSQFGEPFPLTEPVSVSRVPLPLGRFPFHSALAILTAITDLLVLSRTIHGMCGVQRPAPGRGPVRRSEERETRNAEP